jgi:hypothetical protein
MKKLVPIKSLEFFAQKPAVFPQIREKELRFK